MRRLCHVAGVADPARAYRSSLRDLLGPAAQRPLVAAPPSPSAVSDDHTPAEFSLAMPGSGPPSVRVLADPGCTASGLAAGGRVGREALERLARRWGFSTGPLRRIEDLFFPAAPEGTFALWCAMELRQREGPGFKAYVDPAAQGPGRSAQVVEEALARLGYGRAWPALRRHAAARFPDADRFAFFAVDLGFWTAPRVKVYVAHHGFGSDEVRRFASLLPDGAPQQVADFCRVVGGTDRFDRHPLVSCFSFTADDPHAPGGYALHVPVRDYAPDDRVARDRAMAVILRLGIAPGFLDRALAAMTSRRLSDGVGLISYLSLTQEGRRQPRVTAYLSPEAYQVGRPRHAS
ncbi:DMATS family aromatic prenyltransferase [Streptomyces stramineus]|uniref:DMATS family aromatic prenyltransferase n=1 Tax=Streptomyces stramineus TaxID=173861 RepID=A0ABN0ZVL1_9ACTN